MIISSMKSYLKKEYHEGCLRFLSSLLGCILTFYIWNYGNMDVILVNESLILIFSLLFPNKHDDMFFSAALAGMSSKYLLPNPGFVFLLATFVFIIFGLIKKIFVGYGGKYGTIGFFGNLLAVFCSYLNQDCEYPLYDFEYYKMLNWKIYVFGPLVCGVSGFLCYIYHKYFGLTKHVACTVNGLLDSLLLLLIQERPEYDGLSFSLTYGEIFNFFQHIGLLAGLNNEAMVSSSNLTDKKEILGKHFFFIGFLAGWIYIAVMPFFIVGGKNGLMAFLASNIYIRSLRLWSKLPCFNKNQNNHKEIKK